MKLKNQGIISVELLESSLGKDGTEMGKAKISRGVKINIAGEADRTS